MRLLTSVSSLLDDKREPQSGTDKRRLASQDVIHPTFRLHTPASTDRRALQAYIAHEFARVHQAHITSFMPLFLQVHQQGQTQAVIGLNPGHGTEIWLECYLDCPIEQSVATVMGLPVDRENIIEVGNLAVSHRGLGIFLFAVMTCALQEAGYQWMVFTATREVSKLIKRLGYQPKTMAPASPERLGEKIKDWGRYYDAQPQVMAVNLTEAAAVVRNLSALAPFIWRYGMHIQELAQQLREQRSY